ncbi:MAG: class I SAM-dependent methyltransferase [Thermoanaerobaculia bacterium]|nr:class I SAM-dependent methyltransferase [Thermoanaerobaculia bacterium]
MRPETADPGSFRDPSGFVFTRGEELLRQVNLSYRDEYDHLLRSGLYANLVEGGLLVPHEEESDLGAAAAPGAYKVLRPRRVEFVSYPYEWCFGQLQRAALTTLEIQRRALDHGMVLKDASAFNVQFHEGRPVLIDTLSFERLGEGAPWIAYRQFCQHFLAPLALVSRVAPGLSGLLRSEIDGLPLDLASRLLPRRTWLSPGLLAHLHLHARAQRRWAGEAAPRPQRGMSLHQHRALVDSLRGAVERLTWRPEGTVWAEYDREHGYSASEEEEKTCVVGRYLEAMEPGPVLDLGANTGRYSREAAARGRFAVACDFDPAAVERNYRECVASGETGVLPLVVDLVNPSPALGWAGRERADWVSRFRGGCVLALALVHHLAIANNVPLPMVAGFLAELGRWLAVEFVPKSDPQAQRLLVSRDDVFPDYTREGFESAFSERFEILESAPVSQSGRRIYLMRRRG